MRKMSFGQQVSALGSWRTLLILKEYIFFSEIGGGGIFLYILKSNMLVIKNQSDIPSEHHLRYFFLLDFQFLSTVFYCLFVE